MSVERILSIDCGTQSLKALVFDLEGNLLARRQVVFRPYVSPQPGWAEQDPEVFWQALCAACKALWQDIEPQSIGVVTLTSQRGSVVNVDGTGKPLRPAMLWLDQRKTHGQRFIGGPWGWFFRVAGLRETVSYFQSEAEANWIAAYQPDVWRATHKYLLLSGFLTHRLIGRFVDSIGCQVGYVPFDFKRFRWAAGWDWKWLVLPVKPEMLPEVMPPASILGEITREASRQTGIPEGLPFVSGAADKACEVIGSGGLSTHVACLSYGTTATINVTSHRYLEAIPLIPPYPAAVPDHYTMEVQVFRGYWMVSWFRDEFGYPETLRAREEGISPEVLFESLLEEAPVGSMGLMLQPYWTPGVKLPGPEAKGAIIGFGDVHNRAHLYRSILEGLAYALREGKERIEKKTRTPVTALRVSGGGSQSRNAMQLTADVFGLPAARPRLYETSGLGAAIDAAVGMGAFADFESAAAAMTHVAEVFEPDMKHHATYNALYHDVYKPLYRRLKPLYRKIRAITGYPA
ncbi:FGGY-family carbohydrate kinase [Desulfatirhabdium butyrativorans]|uniref:FGGY-family carbohydrate kinase n=1 Tax=Desulfatirhabdium butyrativorans TaxID=340467 RepID=UPI000424BADC|nr:FGGY-family carbohydrate kinase [Desulfatirhabdium butyrativorans]